MEQLADLDFADNIALLASIQPDLANMVTKQKSAKFGLWISGSKTM